MRTLLGLLVLGALVLSLAFALTREPDRQPTHENVLYGVDQTHSRSSELADPQLLDEEASTAPKRAANRAGLTPITVRISTENLNREPVAGINVLLLTPSGEKSELTTGAEGFVEHTLWSKRRVHLSGAVLRAQLAHESYPRLHVIEELTHLHFVGTPVLLRLVAEPGRTISGRVIDQAGNLVEGAAVRFGPGTGDYHLQQTDRAGTWDLHVRPKLKKLFVHARMRGVGASKLTRVDPLSLGPDEIVTLRLVGPKSLSGRVLDSLGRLRTREMVDVRLASQAEAAEESALVRFEHLGGLCKAFATSNNSGVFAVKGLQEAEYVLSIRGVNLKPHPSEPNAWMLPVFGFYLDATLPDGSRGLGSTDHTDGEPEAMFAAQIANVDTFGLRSKDELQSVRIVEGGVAAFEVAGTGPLSLRLYHDSDFMVYAKLPTLVRGQHPTLQVQLEPATSCRLRLTFPARYIPLDYQGVPTNSPFRYGRTTVIDRASGLRVSNPPYPGDADLGVPPGSYVVHYKPPGGGHWIGYATVLRDEEVDVPMTEQAGAEVVVLVDLGKHKHGPPLTLCLRSDSEGWTHVMPSHFGWGEVSQNAKNPSASRDTSFAARPGSYTLLVKHEDGTMREESFKLRAGGRALVRLEL